MPASDKSVDDESSMAQTMGPNASESTDSAPSGDEACALGPGDSIGRYLLISELGAGGMGVVYEGFDPDLDRRVAVKLLHLGPGEAATRAARDTELDQAQLMLEAQSLAKLAHPNIVAIYDVGHAHEQIYMAMELVDGVSLSDWLKRSVRPWRSIVELFVQVADGLAAAHAAKIVHRDMKPDNVIVGHDGRVRILDFGLAHEGHGSQLWDPDRTGRSLNSAPSATQVDQQRHRVAGTPSYMAPEQHAGSDTDGRSDQYALCVSLYQALYGNRPFRGHSLGELARAKLSLKLSPAKYRRRVPRWLHELVLRGLAVDPDKRHPSMAALADQLRDRLSPRRRRSFAVAMVATACVASFSLQVVAGARQREQCSGHNARAATIWNDDADQRLGAAFQSTGVQYADQTHRAVAARLDEYMHSWTEQWRGACKATYLEGTQTPAELRLRNECLEAKLRQVQVVVQRWTQNPDRRTIDDAHAALDRMAPLEDCDDGQSWLNSAALPSDPEARARALDIESDMLEAELAFRVGHYGRATELAQASLEVAEAIDFDKGQTQGHMMLSRLAADTMRADLARRHVARAVDLAEQSGDDRMAARATTEALWIRGYQLAEAARTDELVAHARAHVQRVAHDVDLHAGFLRAHAVVLATQHQLPQSVPIFRELIEVLESEYGVGHPRILSHYANLGLTLMRVGQFAEAETLLARTSNGEAQLYGADHPGRIKNLVNLATLYMQTRRATQALTLMDEVDRISQSSDTDAAMQKLHSWSSWAMMLESVDRWREAARIWRAAFDLHRATSQRDDPRLLISGSALMRVYARLGDTQSIDPLIERLRPLIAQAGRSPEFRGQAIPALLALADVERDRGRLQQAQAQLDQLDGLIGPTNPRGTKPGVVQRMDLALASNNCKVALEQLQTVKHQVADLYGSSLHAERDRMLTKARVLEQCADPRAAAAIYDRLADQLMDDPASHQHFVPRMRAFAAAARLQHDRRSAEAGAWLDTLKTNFAQLDPREMHPSAYARLRKWAQLQTHIGRRAP